MYAENLSQEDNGADMQRCSCGNLFKKNRPNQKYCSSKCRWQQWDKQNPRIKKLATMYNEMTKKEKE